MAKGKQKAPPDARELLRASGAEAVAVILSLMHDTGNKPELRLKAAESILDRACGKAGAAAMESGEHTGAIRFEGELDEWSR